MVIASVSGECCEVDKKLRVDIQQSRVQKVEVVWKREGQRASRQSGFLWRREWRFRTIEASPVRAFYCSLFNGLGGERSEGMVNSEVNAVGDELFISHQPALVVVRCVQQTVRNQDILGAQGV
jgi:hypothetical protein